MINLRATSLLALLLATGAALPHVRDGVANDEPTRLDERTLGKRISDELNSYEQSGSFRKTVYELDPFLVIDAASVNNRRKARDAYLQGLDDDTRRRLSAYVDLDVREPEDRRQLLNKAILAHSNGAHDRVVELLEPHPWMELSVLAIRANSLLAEAYTGRKATVDALARLGRVAETAKNIGWAAREIWARRRQLQSAMRGRRFKQCLEPLERLLSIRSSSVSLMESAGWCRQLGSLCRHFVSSRRAVGWLSEARSIFEGLSTQKNPPGTAAQIKRALVETRVELGLAYMSMGQLARAAQVLEGAAASAPDVGEGEIVAHAKAALGRLCARIGQFERALELLTEAAEISRKSGDPAYASHMGNAAGALRKLGRYDDALTTYASLKEAMAQEDPLQRGRLEIHVAFAELERGRSRGKRSAGPIALAAVARARAHVQGPLAADLPATRVSELLDSCLLVEAAALNFQQRHAEAKQVLINVRDGAIHPKERLMEVALYAELADAYLGTKDPEQAYLAASMGAQAIRTRERGLGRPLTLSHRHAHRDRRVFASLVRAALSTQAPPRVVFALETSRGMRVSSNAPPVMHGPRHENVKKASATLTHALREYWKRLEVGNIRRVQQAARALNKARERFRRTYALSEIRSRSAATSRGERRDVTIDVIQQALRADEAFLYLIELDESIDCLAITRDRATLSELPVGAEALSAMRAGVVKTSRAARSASAARMSQRAVQAFRRVGAEIRKRIGDTLGHVYVCPDRHTVVTPWELAFLGLDDMGVSVVPSAGAWISLQRRVASKRDPRAKSSSKGARKASQKQHMVLAVGDPAYSVIHPGVHVRDRYEHLQRLVYSRDEVRSVAAGKEDIMLLQRDATESRVRESIRTRGGQLAALHFACHGLLNDHDPYMSALALTPHGDDDGFLAVSEIEHLPPVPPLVTLSACESGVGRWVNGEGYMGLVQAFLRRGAKQVVSSLWRVDDEATAKLMTALYRHWRAGKAIPHALASAQRNLRNMKEYADPYFWAGWVVWGLRD